VNKYVDKQHNKICNVFLGIFQTNRFGNMADGTLTGLLLDVSGSMKENATGSVDEEGEWVRSLFQVSLRECNGF